MSLRRLCIRLLAAATLVLPLAAQAQAPTPTRSDFRSTGSSRARPRSSTWRRSRAGSTRKGSTSPSTPGNGSAAGIQRIASGAYDIALADISSLIEFMANNPGPTRMQAVYLLYDSAPLAYFTLKKSGINSIAGLQGRSIAAAPFEVTRKMWPVIARAAKIDPASVKWVTIDPTLRSNTVIKGDADASSGFFNANLEYYARGVKPDELLMFPVADLGLKVYGNAIMASSRLIAENPKAVAAFVKVANRAFREGLADPVTAMRYLKQREPLDRREARGHALRTAVPRDAHRPHEVERPRRDQQARPREPGRLRVRFVRPQDAAQRGPDLQLELPAAAVGTHAAAPVATAAK